MKDNETSLDDVLNSLSVSNIPSKQQAPVSKDITGTDDYDENSILQKALRGLSDLIIRNNEILDEASALVKSTGDKDYIETYASVSKSQSEAYKNLVKIITDKEKNKVAKETKEKEIAVKEKLVDYQIGDLENKKNALPSGATLNQTNIIMPGATREEALDFVRKMREVEKELVEETSKVTDI